MRKAIKLIISIFLFLNFIDMIIKYEKIRIYQKTLEILSEYFELISISR